MLFLGIKKRIQTIISTLDNILRGDLEQKIDIYSHDEIGRLANTINAVLITLKNRITKLQEENSKIQAMLNNMVEGVIAVDKELKIVSINPAIERIFDISRKEAEGRFFLESIRNNDIFEVTREVLEKGEFISREMSLAWPVKGIFQVYVSPLLEKGVACGCLLVIHDITEIRRLEKMRSDFVANVSHELRTPLTSIKGFVETLLEGAWEDKENSRHFLKIIQEHTDRLDNLINDLLELSHIESKEIKLEITEVSLWGLAEEVLSEFRVQIKKKAIEVKNDLPFDLSVKADRGKIKQVLANLIDNAIKFNKDRGAIKIYINDLADRIKVIVEDSGIGIPEKDVPRIFERFYRVDRARSRQLGGTGLGLSIVKHIIELHSGNVGLDSIKGLGSKFWFTLPK